MRVALNIDGLSDALETGLNLSVALRRDAPQTERSGRARATRVETQEDGYASAGDDTRSYKSNDDASDEYGTSLPFQHFLYIFGPLFLPLSHIPTPVILITTGSTHPRYSLPGRAQLPGSLGRFRRRGPRLLLRFVSFFISFFPPFLSI